MLLSSLATIINSSSRSDRHRSLSSLNLLLLQDLHFLVLAFCWRCKEMGRMDYLAMRTNPAMDDLISSDIFELKVAAKRLFNHATQLGGLGFGTTFLKWTASLAAIYLLILDRTNWRTNMLTSLLVPYVFFSLPSSLFHMVRDDIGKWVAFTAVVLRLFFPRHFPEWLAMPGSLILLLTVAPHFFAHTLRDRWIGVLICLLIGCYLLQEHIRATGGFRNSLTQTHGISNTLGIVLLIVFPVWALVLHFF
ncbi:cold-regulated 413 plasma membrane protein 2-like [Rhodamnia argentea]|uniref:Cold-regulated 413 plasma membrane protein 2-like n=1 Tax=Rhodamnia argentea TaxID=178133 RepID=A0A8B8MMG4_9MYRT|nr:cold-regulated 413 plasma membrane protein 2-like [Rhodamnia argentea]